jgi:hypothetical protein
MASAGLPVTATLSSLKAEKRQMFEAAARKQTQVQEDRCKGTVEWDFFHHYVLFIIMTKQDFSYLFKHRN